MIRDSTDARWISDDLRRFARKFGQRAEVFNVYSAGDSGEGCEIIEFTTPSRSGPIPWTARVFVEDGRSFTEFSVGW